MGKRKPNPPRRKSCDRASRLKMAKAWLRAYQGKNIVRGYRKHFGVDLLCAIKELQMLGVKIEPSYIEVVKATIAAEQKRKMENRREELAKLYEHCDSQFAYIAGYTAGGVPYGVTWEEMGEEPPDFDSIFSLD